MSDIRLNEAAYDRPRGILVDELAVKDQSVLEQATALAADYRETVVSLFRCRAELLDCHRRQGELAESFASLTTTSEKIAAQIRTLAAQE